MKGLILTFCILISSYAIRCKGYNGFVKWKINNTTPAIKENTTHPDIENPECCQTSKAQKISFAVASPEIKVKFKANF